MLARYLREETEILAQVVHHEGNTTLYEVRGFRHHRPKKLWSDTITCTTQYAAIVRVTLRDKKTVFEVRNDGNVELC